MPRSVKTNASRPSGAMFSAPSISKREKFKMRSSRPKGMKAMSATARDVRHRGFFALRFFNRWKRTMTIRRCFGRLDWHTVLAQNVNSGAVDRLAVLDRHQEDVAAAIRIFLR